MNYVKLSVSGLNKSYLTPQDNILNVLDSVSLTVKKGEFVCLLGPSGCGKSTFFHILSGLEKEDSGDIFLNEKKLHNRQGAMGYMFQDSLLMPWKNVLENIMLGMEIKGVSKNIAYKKALNLLKEFKLDNYSEFYPGDLSGGMKQRIALLRTVAFNSDILLLDEPFGSLDALTRITLQDYLLKLWKKLKLTILFITHDVHEAVSLSDRIYVFGPKPATIIKTVEIKLPRPRKLANLMSSYTSHIEQELFRILLKDNL